MWGPEHHVPCLSLVYTCSQPTSIELQELVCRANGLHHCALRQGGHDHRWLDRQEGGVQPSQQMTGEWAPTKGSSNRRITAGAADGQ